MIRAEEIGIRFTFDRHRRVVTPNTARFRSGTSTNWGIRGVSFSALGGEGIGLIGRSGSGKTTMLRTLAGVYVPDEGQLQVRGPVASLLAIDAGRRLVQLNTKPSFARLEGWIDKLNNSDEGAEESATPRRRHGDLSAPQT